MTVLGIVKKYISFFEKWRHKRIPNASLVPQNDPTTLFTSSGMQPLVPYLLGEPHPQGKRLVNVQNCFRAQDIDEVGDNRHTTFFRMLGNWSLGDYFKKEQLPWFFEFLTKELKLPANKLYVTVFEGSNDVPRDDESANIWKEIFEKIGLDPKKRISYYGVDKNWWSRSGIPENMPPNEPGGPDSEVFYDFETLHDKKYGDKCHPNCSCGRFLEIGNSVFMEYQKQQDGSFKKLPQKNVDFGGGLERLLAAVENQQDIFKTSLYLEVIKSLEALTKTDKNYKTNPKPYRIIADHLTASIFMVSDGVIPENKGRGYILRRLIRRAMVQSRKLGMSGDEWLSNISPILEVKHNVDNSLKMDAPDINFIITQEVDKFRRTIEEGIKELKKIFGRAVGGVDPEISKGIIMSNNVIKINGKEIFRIYETYGLPPEIAQEIMTEWGLAFDEQTMKECNEAMGLHQQASRAGSVGMFKGGLADHSEKTIMGHTATHLMHQAIRDVLGNHIHQTGSNITTERIRFDFNYDKKLTDEEIKKVENIVNKKIKDNLKVYFEMMPLEKAKKIGAIGLFDEKYQEDVKIYFIGGPSTLLRQAQDRSGRLSTDKPYSIEFCGGPHVDFTSKLKRFKIIKQENIGHGQKRLYAVVGE